MKTHGLHFGGISLGALLVSALTLNVRDDLGIPAIERGGGRKARPFQHKPTVHSLHRRIRRTGKPSGPGRRAIERGRRQREKWRARYGELAAIRPIAADRYARGVPAGVLDDIREGLAS